MKNIRKIEYQQLNSLDLLAIYLACTAIRAGKSGVYLTNDALQNLFSVKRVHDTKINCLIQKVRRIFPYSEFPMKTNLKEVILWATNEPTRKYERITRLPGEAEMLTFLGFQTHQMTLENLESK